MYDIQAVVRYDDGNVHECHSLAAVENLVAVDRIRKITFYNAAKAHVEMKFRNVPYTEHHNREYLTHVGETAQFIIYNW